MKIKIEFTESEKNVLSVAVGCQDNTDSPEFNQGKYGHFEYNPELNKIDIDLSEKFIFAIANMINQFIGLIENFVNLSDKFTNEWFNKDYNEDIEEIMDQIHKFDSLCDEEISDRNNNQLQDLLNNIVHLLNKNKITRSNTEIINRVEGLYEVFYSRKRQLEDKNGEN